MSKVKEANVPAGNVSEFSKLVEKLQHVDVNMCFQCKKCASGCPLADVMDYTPTQIIHATRLGLKDLVLNSNTFWLCVNCGACATRCPHEINHIEVMDALAQIAKAEGIKPKEKAIAKFWELGVDNIKAHGKMWELGLMGQLKLSTGNIMQDVPMGLKMMSQGKMELLPPSHNKAVVKRIFDKVKEREG